MNTIITINQVLDILKLYTQQEGSLLQDFGYGPVSQIGQSRAMKYPYLWVTHTASSSIVLSDQNKTTLPIVRFTFLVVDKVNDSININNINGEDSFNGQEIISDSFQITQDLVNFIHTSVELRRLQIKLVEDVTWDPFFDEEDDKTNGVQATFSLRLPYVACGTTPLIPVCTPATYRNSDNTYNQIINSGYSFISSDINITLADGVQTFPSNVDIDLSQYAIVSNPNPGNYIPGTFQLPWNSNSNNVDLNVDGTITKILDGDMWNGGADFIIEKTGNFTLNFTLVDTVNPNATNIMAGIDFFKANSNFDYTGIDMCWYRAGLGAYIFENGNNVYSYPTLIDDNTLYTIERQSNFIFYKINGTTVRTQSVINLGKMFFTSSIYNLNAQVKDINITY